MILKKKILKKSNYNFVLFGIEPASAARFAASTALAVQIVQTMRIMRNTNPLTYVLFSVTLI